MTDGRDGTISWQRSYEENGVAFHATRLTRHSAHAQCGRRGVLHTEGAFSSSTCLHERGQAFYVRAQTMPHDMVCHLPSCPRTTACQVGRDMVIIDDGSSMSSATEGDLVDRLHQIDQCPHFSSSLGKKARIGMCSDIPQAIKADCWLETCCGIGLQWLVAERAQAWCQRCGTNLCAKEFGLTWILGTVCACARHPRIGLSQRSMDRTVSSSSSFLKKEPMVLSELVQFGPCFLAETVKTRTLIGLHMVAEENALRSDSDSSLDLGGIVEVWLPTKPCAREQRR